ncbi:MAG: ParM/StbA family protein [Geminicoccaceae bacterium]|nr:MAG: ParM/StbA family protein [Geminicoccaceae bacterium]
MAADVHPDLHDDASPIAPTATGTFGLDIGYSNLKTAELLDPRTAALRTRLRPAGAGPLADLTRGIDRGDVPTVVEIDGVAWAAAVPHQAFEGYERGTHERYWQTDGYLALARAGLADAGTTTIRLLITGLPVAQAKDPATKRALEHRLGGVHPVGQDGLRREVRVERVRVVPQPLGAFVDAQTWFTDAEMLREGRVLVLDPGFFSVDWAVFEATRFRPGSSATSHFAMSVLLEHAVALVKEETGLVVPPERFEIALREGRHQVLGEGRRFEAQPYLERAATKVSAQVMTHLERSLRGEETRPDVIVLAGGGAALYRPAVEALFPRSVVAVAAAPALANVRGFALIAAKAGS